MSADLSNFAGWTLGLVSYKEMSLDDQISKIRDAIRRKFNPSEPPYGMGIPSSDSTTVWVLELYPDYAIICKGSDHFKVRFACEDGQVIVSDHLIPVEKIWREKE